MSADDDSETPGRQRAATILDVADAAGVAVGTVSRYLNGQTVRVANREQIVGAAPPEPVHATGAPGQVPPPAVARIARGLAR